jgi:hypothetical protein
LVSSTCTSKINVPLTCAIALQIRWTRRSSGRASSREASHFGSQVEQAAGSGERSLQEETDDPLVADRRNFFKVELWTRDGRHVERLLFAGNSLDKARALFAAYGRRRPRARLTIRQRSRVLEEWPKLRA